MVDAFIAAGVSKVRLTGGEPLLRKDLRDLERVLASKAAIRDLAMTTNGVLFAKHAAELCSAGLGRVTTSLDTLRPDRFEMLSRRRSHGEVLEALGAAAEVGFTGTKVDTVVMRGVNDDELIDLIEFAKTVGAEVRFIEYMDLGGATQWDPALVCSAADMLRVLPASYGEIRPADTPASSPAHRFVLPDGTTFGIVASTTQPLCGACDRSRLTTDGMWYRCLYAVHRCRPAPGAAVRRVTRAAPGDHRRHMGGSARSGGRRSSGPTRGRRAASGNCLAKRPASGDAHPRRVAAMSTSATGLPCRGVPAVQGLAGSRRPGRRSVGSRTRWAALSPTQECRFSASNMSGSS